MEEKPGTLIATVACEMEIRLLPYSEPTYTLRVPANMVEIFRSVSLADVQPSLSVKPNYSFASENLI
jgi:hypothetical protein